MAIIDTAQPTPAQLTVDTLTSGATGAFVTLKAQWDNAYQLLWHNPWGLTPQEVLDALGTDAVQLFALSDATKTLLNAWGANITATFPPEYSDVTINPDGTCILVKA